jgi:hypothetical protein
MITADFDWEGLFASLTQSPLQIALVVTGGGSGAVAHCFRRAGASAVLVEAVIPYSRLSLANYLNVQPRGSSASPARAHQLAATALARAGALTDREMPYETAGLALVAALPTIHPRKGADRIHVSLHTQRERELWSAELPKDAFDRDTAEAITEEMIFIALSGLRRDAEATAAESPSRSPSHLRCGVPLTHSLT